MKCAGFVFGAVAVSLSIQQAHGATVSGTSAAAYQQEALISGSVVSGGSFTTRIAYDGTNESRGVYEFVLPTLPNGGSYNTVSLNYSVAETNSGSGAASRLRFFRFAGNGRYDSPDSTAVGTGILSPQFFTTGQYNTPLPAADATSYSNAKKSFFGVTAWQDNLGFRTGVGRGPSAGGAPTLSYAANVPDTGTLSTRAMVDVLATQSSGTYSLTEAGTSINTQETLNGSTNRRGILEFNLNGLPVGATITSATLKFDVATFTRSTVDSINYEYANPRIYGYNGNGVADGNTSATPDATRVTNLIATGNDVTALGEYSITLDPNDVQALLGPNNIVGMLVRSSDQQQFSFYTSDSTDVNNVPVTLDITYAIPEPTALAGLAMVTAGLLSRRRKM